MDWQNSILPQLTAAGQILLAMFLAGFVGFERETKDKPAGMRTHILVGGAAALFVILGKMVTREMISSLGADIVKTDPVRILQAILTGISFLGAGAILRNHQGEEEPRGMTTAASILFVSGIGVTVASSQYILAILMTILALFILHGLHSIERRLNL